MVSCLVLSYFFMFVSIMQLYDYAFWQHPPWSINYIHFQPLILAGLIVLYGKQLTTLSKIMLAMGHVEDRKGDKG